MFVLYISKNLCSVDLSLHAVDVMLKSTTNHTFTAALSGVHILERINKLFHCFVSSYLFISEIQLFFISKYDLTLRF